MYLNKLQSYIKMTIFNFVKSIQSYIWSSEERYVWFIFVSFFVLSLSGFIHEMKIFTFILLCVVYLIWFKIRNLFLSFVLTSILSLCLLSPQKYYHLELFSGSEMLEPLYKGGMSMGYGLNIANIFEAVSFYILITSIVRSKLVKKFTDFIWFRIIIISWLGFVSAAIISNQSSPFPILSAVWMVQYCQMYIFSLCILGVRILYPLKFKLVYISILATIFLQSVVGVSQYFVQSYLNLPIESGYSRFATGLDENNAVFRVAGTFRYDNQYALIMCILLNLAVPYVVHRKSKLLTLLLFIGCITTILSLCRSIWIALSLCSLIWYKKYRGLINKFLIKVSSDRKIVMSFILMMLVAAPSIIPRILLSVNFFFEGAGGPIRSQLISEGVQALSQSFWLGYGVGTNEYTLFNLFPDGTMRIFPFPVHLAYLQLALEVGVIGLGFVLLPFVILLRQSFFRKVDTSFLTATITFLIYWLFLAMAGNIEFAYLGLILGFGLVHQYNLLENDNKY